MSEFVDECRREWKRLGVPDTIADEMAADITRDIDEAQSEGEGPEQVLGNAASDPRAFAASWAIERGVAQSPALGTNRRHRTALSVIALVTLLAVAGVTAWVIFGKAAKLNVSSGSQTTAVPIVLGESLAMAEHTLSVAGFVVSVKNQTVSDPAQVGRVNAQVPAANTKVPADWTVTIDVGSHAG